MEDIANFLFEIGTLKRMVRNSYQTLGSGGETIAEHSFRCAMIGYALAKLEEEVDEDKVTKMCLFHDLLETRTGDQNWVHAKYVRSSEEEARQDQCRGLPFGKEMLDLLKEYEERKTKEAIIVKDADVLEQLLQEKEYYEIGNKQAELWMEHSKGRIKTENGLKLAEAIMDGSMKNWYLELKEKPSKKKTIE